MTPEMTAMLQADSYAVVGASRDPAKFGSLVYRALKAAGKRAWAVNPGAEAVDGDPCWPSLGALPEAPAVAVLVVPAAASEAAVQDCARLGVRHVWMQPGAESEAAVSACRAHGIAVVSGGPCLLVLFKTAPVQR